MRSEATTVEEYLAELPEERREVVSAVLETVRSHLPAGYEEDMAWGMISWSVPLETYPDTYNGKPLLYAALASQKKHVALYLQGVYCDEATREAFVEAYRATGKRLDMGKSCVRFRRLEDLPLELVGETIASMPVDDYVERVQSIHS